MVFFSLLSYTTIFDAIPKAAHNPSPRPNSVHKCSKTAPRGHFYRFVYTPASSPWR